MLLKGGFNDILAAVAGKLSGFMESFSGIAKLIGLEDVFNVAKGAIDGFARSREADAIAAAAAHKDRLEEIEQERKAREKQIVDEQLAREASTAATMSGYDKMIADRQDTLNNLAVKAPPTPSAGPVVETPVEVRSSAEAALGGGTVTPAQAADRASGSDVDKLVNMVQLLLKTGASADQTKNVLSGSGAAKDLNEKQKQEIRLKVGPNAGPLLESVLKSLEVDAVNDR